VEALQAKLVEIRAALYRMLHVPVPDQGRWLGQVVRGYLAYHGVPTNARAITSSFTASPGTGSGRLGAAAKRGG